MFSIISTVLLYNGVFISALFLCSLHKKSFRKVSIFLAYFLIFLLSAFRFDIGSDYDGYAILIEGLASEFRQFGFQHLTIIQGMQGLEPIFVWIIYLFSYTSEPVAWVYATYALLCMIFLYTALDKIGGHKWGLFLFYISCLNFFFWDGLRQGLSIAILLNSYTFIKNKQLVRFLILTIVATLAHYSAFIFVLAYFIGQLNVSKKIAVFACLVFFVLAQLDVLSRLNAILVSLVPYYSDIYLAEDLNTRFTYHDMSYLFISLWLMFILWLIPKEEKSLTNIVMMGTILYIIAGGILNVDRVGLYFNSFQIIAIPIIMANRKPVNTRRLITAGMIILFILCNIRVLSTTYHGCSPYETVFSKEFHNKQYRGYRY